MRPSRVLLGALILMACDMTGPGPVCGCPPMPGGSAVFAGSVLGVADAPVAGAVVSRLQLQDFPCTAPIPSVRVVDTTPTGSDGRFRQSTAWSGGHKCWLMWADPPSGSALAGSDTLIVHVDFNGQTPVRDSLELVFRLRGS